MAIETETTSESGEAAPSETARPWALKSLPPFPAVALQLLSVLDDDEVPMKKIVALLRIDPALSVEILRVSNSALWGIHLTQVTPTSCGWAGLSVPVGAIDR